MIYAVCCLRRYSHKRNIWHSAQNSLLWGEVFIISPQISWPQFSLNVTRFTPFSVIHNKLNSTSEYQKLRLNIFIWEWNFWQDFLRKWLHFCWNSTICIFFIICPPICNWKRCPSYRSSLKATVCLLDFFLHDEYLFVYPKTQVKIMSI